MKYPIALLFTFLLWMARPAAQDLEGGLFFGLASYQGDLVEGIVEVSETNMALGLLLRRYLDNDRWTVRANFFAARLSGDDANGSKHKDRGYKFQSDIYELSGAVEWYFFDLNRYASTGRRLKTINMYIYLGAGAVFFNPSAQGFIPARDLNYNKVTLVIPAGGGIKFDILPRTSIAMEMGFRPTYSDFVDGIGGPGQGTANDWYGIAGLQVTVLLE